MSPSTEVVNDDVIRKGVFYYVYHFLNDKNNSGNKNGKNNEKTDTDVAATSTVTNDKGDINKKKSAILIKHNKHIY